RVLLMAMDGSSPDRVVLNEQDGAQAPSGLALGPSDRTLFVADSVAQSVSLYDLDSRTPLLTLPLNWNPGPFVPLGPDRLLINRSANPDEPFLFLDTSAAPRVLFVPAGK